ncbi:hypothetical protein [Microbulbifer sp. YPW1]|uniref:hypothetical protein n=1 Tax=Microbulbifer sp. YPW1 TaxID=2745199 RepID=UPI00159B2EA0|nr:hypothetical protein [Microbulbifer sp. YPW1]QKX15658.1 hypothetical protein HUW35_00815 [Microbulbifer sp. YPW1]
MVFEKNKTVIAASILAIITLLVWLPVTGFGFVWDDNQFLKSELYFHNFDLFLQALQSPFFVSQNYYRPLPLIVLYLVGDDAVSASPYHWLLLCIHLANTLLLFSLLLILLKNSSFRVPVALIAALFFAVNPVTTEVVAWISGIFDGLFATFAILLFLVDFRARSTSVRLVLIFFLYLCAALTKEMAAAFVLIFPVWHFFLMKAGLLNWKELSERKRLVCTYTACFFAGITYLLIRYFTLGYLYIPSGVDLYSEGVAFRVGLIVKAIGYYILHLLYPVWDISPVNPVDSKLVFSSNTDFVYFAAGSLLIMTVTFAALKRKWNILLPLALFLASIFPVLHLMPMSIGDNFAHLRFIYFPLMVALLGLAIVIGKVSIRFTPGAWFASGLVVLLLIAVTRSVTPFWVNDYTFWHWVKSIKPSSATAKTNYYAALASHGECEVVLREAFPDFKNNNGTLPLLTTIAGCFAEKGDVAVSEKLYEIVMADFYVQGFSGYDKRVASIYLNIATMYFNNPAEGRLNKAEGLVEAALQIEPGNLKGIILSAKIAISQSDEPLVKRQILRAMEVVSGLDREESIKMLSEELGVSVSKYL